MTMNLKTPTKKLIASLIIIPIVIGGSIYIWWPLIGGMIVGFYIMDHFYSGPWMIAFAIIIGIVCVWWEFFLDIRFRAPTKENKMDKWINKMLDGVDEKSEEAEK